MEEKITMAQTEITFSNQHFVNISQVIKLYIIINIFERWSRQKVNLAFGKNLVRQRLELSQNLKKIIYWYFTKVYSLTNFRQNLYCLHIQKNLSQWIQDCTHEFDWIILRMTVDIFYSFCLVTKNRHIVDSFTKTFKKIFTWLSKCIIP